MALGNDGDTPLHDACRSGHDKCAGLLLKHQGNPADPNATSTSFSTLRETPLPCI